MPHECASVGFDEWLERSGGMRRRCDRAQESVPSTISRLGQTSRPLRLSLVTLSNSEAKLIMSAGSMDYSAAGVIDCLIGGFDTGLIPLTIA